jgi:hypothetical protein
MKFFLNGTSTQNQTHNTMPYWNVVRIVPLSLLSAWQAATALGGDSDGLNATTNTYTAADAPPRSATHVSGNGSLNAAQLALLTGAGTDVNGYVQVENITPGLAGCLVKVWDRSLGNSANPHPAMLEEHELTLESGV